MNDGDRILRLCGVVLRMLVWLNWLFVALFIGGLLLSFPAVDLLGAQLARKYRPDIVPGAIAIIRGVGLLGILGCGAIHMMLAPLRDLVATFRAGNPFVGANARRLQTIGWALLVFQLLDLAMGALQIPMMRLKLDHLDWQPSLMGWIAVLLIFVLARVFRVGAAMRDDLEMTV